MLMDDKKQNCPYESSLESPFSVWMNGKSNKNVKANF